MYESRVISDIHFKNKQKPQHQKDQPGRESVMEPKPVAMPPVHPSHHRLENKVVLITGGDSGIGRAVALAFAKEGAHCTISYLNEKDDAEETVSKVNEFDRECITFAGDLGDPVQCKDLVEKTIAHFGKIDVLVNNIAEQHPTQKFEDIPLEQLTQTFRTNIFSYFYMCKFALAHMKADSCIINSTSVVAYKGNPELIDYAATKGAIVAFTRSLALHLVERNIRVNGVAPGPIWTPLIPASFEPQKVAHFGEQVPMARAGQPNEIAPSYVFLASEDAAYMTGQILHPNGGVIVNG